ncbi:CocE/NonD family hydrolase [Butyrivibrio sp. JL13D10]|uniref:CocE/NonD family hydrolase n=1 Tax=Butyrivibrio sp. JL13D10 TaxID=3236815 RepID=UPI0038B58596
MINKKYISLITLITAILITSCAKSSASVQPANKPDASKNIDDEMVNDGDFDASDESIAEDGTFDESGESIVEDGDFDASDYYTYEEYDGNLIIADGTLFPMLNYSDRFDEYYTNEGSEIQRFCVYVETDHDTDNDGKADLVKAFVQVPASAVNGIYKAATIYDPTPYAAGTVEPFESFGENSSEDAYLEKPFDYDKLYQAGSKRKPAGEMSTTEAALNADPDDWNYIIENTGQQGYLFGTYLDYYLVRGYAIVEACGIGTYGSEGFELCGTDLERDSHKCVVEWLTGDRIAYTDKENNIQIKADWSNGKVAMTGVSYGGTLPYEVATTGVKGLETIIPCAGIASWYDYTNSQGVSITQDSAYKHYLAFENCGGVFLDDDWKVLNDDYRSWLWQVRHDEEETNGNYAPIWAASDYSEDYEKINCSALIAQGLNDINVSPKHAKLMYNAFKRAGKTVKLFLHQDGHNSPAVMEVNGEPWLEIANKWLAHYLYDVDNGIENMAEITAQNNITGEYDTYDSFGEYEKCTVFPENNEEETTITSEGLGEYTTYIFPASEYTLENQEKFYLQMSPSNLAIYDVNIPDGATISGTPEVHTRLSTKHNDLDGLMITAILMDTVEEGEQFDAYICTSSDNVSSVELYDLDVGGGAPSATIEELKKTPTNAKCVAYGWTDLANPGCGPNGYEYTGCMDIEANKFYDYTFYMTPTVYTVEEGHTLKLLLMTWDPYRVFLDESFSYDQDIPEPLDDYNYSYVVDNEALYANLPLVAE